MRNVRRYLAVVLAMAFLLPLAGLPVYFHYCGGELEEVSYYLESGNCCGDESDDDGCCSNEQVVVTYAADYISGKDIQAPAPCNFILADIFTAAPVLPLAPVLFNESGRPPAVETNIIKTTVLRI